MSNRRNSLCRPVPRYRKHRASGQAVVTLSGKDHYLGPLALKTIREKLLAPGYCRKYVNEQVAVIVRMFQWAVGEELVPPAVYQALKLGRCLGLPADITQLYAERDQELAKAVVRKIG